MSKIARIRIVNLNYNHDSINVDDKVFDLGGESTLISLRNGGGKSVLVQMLVSLFVHKTYRDFGDRKFKNYFNTNKPTFFMTEWQLDQSSDRILVGMMVRKNQREDNDVEELEMFTFTGSYAEGCKYDMDHIPIIKVNGNNKILKGFGECKTVLEEISKDKNGDFRLYDMSSQYNRSQYFKTLKQYQIDYKEWESIIRKVNQKESGLSDLFQNAKDEKNLIENWFLKPIEDKLNVDKNKVDEFQKLTFLFIEQYKRNQSNIIRKKIIEKYFEDTILLKEEIDTYVAQSEEKKEATAQMVLYIRTLGETIQRITEEITETEEEMVAIQVYINRVVYERISYDLYKKQEEKQEVVQKRVDQEVMITAYKKSIKDMEEQLNLYDCSKIYEEIKDLKEQKAEVDEKINVLVTDSQVTQTEIKELGHTLHVFYQKELQITQDEFEKTEKKVTNTLEEKKEKCLQKGETEKAIRELENHIGKMQQAVEGYNEVEDVFNKKYHCQLKRNILGQYPDGFLAVTFKEIEEETQDERNKLVRFSKKKSNLEIKLRNLIQEEQNNITRIAEVRHNLELLQERLTTLEGEKQERLRIVKYVGMKEAELDNKPLLLDRIERKIRDLDVEKAGIITKKAALEKQYRQLKEGKTMELPANVQEYFEENGIESYYGMEWLTKNGRSAEENATLVAKNPFIPYAIVMEQDMFERFRNTEKELYTSFPIPIILRGDLEKSVEDMQGSITTYGNIHFFLKFNYHLLNKEELLKMLSQLDKKIVTVEKQIADKTADIHTFSAYKLKIENQIYCKSLYEKTQKEMQIAQQEKESLVLRQKDIKEAKEENTIEQKDTNKKIEESKERIRIYGDRKQEFEILCDKYAIYETNQKTLHREQKEIEEWQQKQINMEKEIEELASELEESKSLARQYKENIVALRKNVVQYETFAREEKDKETSIDKTTASQMEARYKALIQKVSEAMGDLRARQRKLADQVEKKKAELARKNKNNLSKDQYADLVFTEEQYDATENKIKREKFELNAALEKNTEFERQNVRLDENIKNLREQLLRETGNVEPIARKVIVDTDFEKRIRLKSHEEDVAKNKLILKQNKKNELSALASGVAEFTDDTIEVSEEKLAEIKKGIPDLSQMEKSALEKYQKERKNNLRDIQETLTMEKDNIAEKIRELSLKEEYADDYFRKALANLLSQVNDAYNLAKQFAVNTAAYENQLEKLKVDLENIEKEQKNIEEMFLEYIESINANIAMIDKNSTITVRNRSIKMLRIQVPDWDSEKEHFRIRLHDFFETVIKNGLETINKNQNLEEYLGKIISVKNLYDDVVGIQNVKIKLYKIEAEREVPITWAEVSANSGGEGFLSAFVILSCLLSYMRRDEHDMFTVGEEGKVLIMDNPFAQTYSAHLLKPLMEMAKKTNTQLICLSGLGGDSIYNRFDNIYVVKLVDSNIRNGVQRLESKHIKGDSVKKMVLSDFKTEQVSLFDMIEEER